ncbi:MAG: ATP-binding cassette domain-containing protein, partial [Chloroflexota bacterium]|nr:ATP-binding cassette domain-containing protein [Chloroflexota bacterium]
MNVSGPLNNKSMLSVRNLKVHFPIRRGILQRQVGAVRAVDGITFDIMRGETFGLVGESGCGKTTTGRAILQLYTPTAGEIEFDGVALAHLDPKSMRDMRRRMQMIFQDPFASLNPRLSVGATIAEPIRIHSKTDKLKIQDRVNHLLEVVGLSPDVASRYPHEFSGGQRQRVGIARALASEPDFIVCDEPISALDVSIQAQVVNLIEDLRADIGLTYLFIGHDLSMIRHISDRVAVMYLGHIVELAETDQLFVNALNPYTVSLISAIPVPDPLIEAK